MKFKTFWHVLCSLSLSLSLSLVLSLSSETAAYAADSTSFNPLPVQVSAQSNGGVPVGTVVAWPVASNPSDADSWLECNGQSTIGYPELAEVIGAAVPDLRGKFLRGLGGNSAGLGINQGDAIRNITGSLMPSYAGGGIPMGFSPPSNSGISGAFVRGDRTQYTLNGEVYPGHGLSFDASNVVPTANENRPVNTAVRYLIRARP